MINKSKLGKQSRVKGHAFEREVVKLLKDIGFECSTSRFSSREHDNKCIDVFFHDKTPLAIQCKSTSNNFPNPVKELNKIQTDTDYKLLAVKIKNKGNYAVMELNDLLELLQMLKKNNIL